MRSWIGRMKNSLCCIAFAFSVSAFSLTGCGGGGGTSATISTTATSGTLPGAFLLAFHACDTSTVNCSSPQNHSTYLAYSDDGVSWTPLSDVTAFQGSVPDIIRRGDTLYIFNPGTVRKYTISAKTLGSSTSVTMTKSDGSAESFVDPSPYLDTSTNKIILFYLSSTGVTGDPAQCTTCPMRSATEVDGSDGTQFVVDSGDRILISNGTDPDTFYDGSQYIMYISKGPSVLVSTSTTLKGTYSLVSTLTNGTLTNVGGIPAGQYDSATAKYWTYVHTASSPSVIKRAIHSDFSKTLSDSDFSTVVSGSTYTGLGSSYSVQSPGFAVNQ